MQPWKVFDQCHENNKGPKWTDLFCMEVAELCQETGKTEDGKDGDH